MEFYKGKRVLITGHTGFKGSWMCRLLIDAGAEVVGYALDPPTDPSLFEACNLDKEMNSINGDIRDFEHLHRVVSSCRPEIIIHMAAQPLVRESYRDPVGTYSTNVMGTVNILEAARRCPSVRSVVNVTTDKVYLNKEWSWGYREIDELNGFDPYSNSKSCSELITSAYKNSFFGGDHGLTEDGRQVAVSTCRAGNVIGGGDFARDRIIPDCIRAVSEGNPIVVRNPHSIRPYQHVLEPVTAYLMIAQKQYEDLSYAGSYNIGPNEADCKSTGELVDLFCKKWNEATADDISLKKATWISKNDKGPHEASFLKLDCSKFKTVFGWRPKWNIEKAVEKIIEWNIAYLKENGINETMTKQIEELVKN